MKTRLLNEAEINEAMRDMKARKEPQPPFGHRLFIGIITGIAIGAAVAVCAGIVIERVNYERVNAGAVWQ